MGALHKLQKVKLKVEWGSLSLHGMRGRVCEGMACCAGWLLGTAEMEKALFFSPWRPLKFPNLSNAIAVRIERRRINEE